ncbi:WbqC family protein [Dyadobacter sp. CY345]|uniref:WbqC family protein n=1 Tax=Dyadobacter sp. CY345 TaxID=2909335 RepID=UPI001F1C5957|nr:WbqC family protein [Dyadobacter sp. CY345]MCF2443073.1 WbqC family protein [Dyadobacter sp. CY345]
MPEFITNNTPEKIVRIELQYLPCLEYFACILSNNLIWVDIEERYVKQTYRNRCDVMTTNKIDTLTVPVQSYAQQSLTKDIKIDYSQHWIRRHWGCFRSAYGKSPYFEFFADELEAVYLKKPQFLTDLNYDLLTICLRLLGIRKEIRYNLSVPFQGDRAVIDALSTINDKKNRNINNYYQPFTYYQTFGNDFVSNLSIVDLLFNMGPEARSILLRSCKQQ